MQVDGRMYGSGAELTNRYHIGATVTANTLVMDSDNNGVINVTTTSAADALGLTFDAGTYDATPAVGALGSAMISWAPDNLYSAVMCGGATAGTALTIMTNTAAGTTTVTSADAQANDMVGGTVWRLQPPGNEAYLSDYRIIVTHTGSTSVVATVAFETAIAVGDRFLMCPWSHIPQDGTAGQDGGRSIQLTSDFTQADATVASGTGIEVHVVGMRLKSATDSEVIFDLRDHVLRAA